MDHNWSSNRFVHSAPGAVDCWDMKVKCYACGTEAVEARGRYLKPERYNSLHGSGSGFHAGMAYDDPNAWRKRIQPTDLVEMDCGLIQVRKVMER